MAISRRAVEKNSSPATRALIPIPRVSPDHQFAFFQAAASVSRGSVGAGAACWGRGWAASGMGAAAALVFGAGRVDAAAAFSAGAAGEVAVAAGADGGVGTAGCAGADWRVPETFCAWLKVCFSGQGHGGRGGVDERVGDQLEAEIGAVVGSAVVEEEFGVPVVDGRVEGFACAACVALVDAAAEEAVDAGVREVDGEFGVAVGVLLAGHGVGQVARGAAGGVEGRVGGVVALDGVVAAALCRGPRASAPGV